MEIFRTEAFKLWAKDKPPEFNAMAYFDFLKELAHANRLEF